MRPQQTTACDACGESDCENSGHAECVKGCDIPPGAIPVPVGTYTNQYIRAHRDAARPSWFTIYLHEWYQGGNQLGPGGKKHLQQIIDELVDSEAQVLIEAAPVTVERYPNLKIASQQAAQQDQARLQMIIEQLKTAGIAEAEQRVQVGMPVAEGLDGNQAPQIYQQMNSGRAGSRGGFGSSGGSGNFGSGSGNTGFGGGSGAGIF